MPVYIIYNYFANSLFNVSTKLLIIPYIASSIESVTLKCVISDQVSSVSWPGSVFLSDASPVAS